MTDWCYWCGVEIEAIVEPDGTIIKWSDGAMLTCRPSTSHVSDGRSFSWHEPAPAPDLPPIEEAIAGLQAIEADLR